jgi:hypothetical protein
MSKIDTSKIDMEKVKAAALKTPPERPQSMPPQTELSEDDKSKDAFFVQVAEVSEAMIARHGNEFAIGTLVLAAKFIAEGRPLSNRGVGNGEAAHAAKPG